MAKKCWDWFLQKITRRSKANTIIDWKSFRESLLIYSENSFFKSKKHFFDIRSKNKFLWIKESFVNLTKFSFIHRNRFNEIKENVFESTKLSPIQRKFFFDRISKKLFSGCDSIGKDSIAKNIIKVLSFLSFIFFT